MPGQRGSFKLVNLGHGRQAAGCPKYARLAIHDLLEGWRSWEIASEECSVEERPFADAPRLGDEC